jgi:hypothetical protein
VEGGIQMTDLLHYAIPYGFIGRIANNLLVASKVRKIFDYREEAIAHLFGTK